MNKVAGVTGLEPATSCVTGRRSNQTELHPHYIYLSISWDESESVSGGSEISEDDQDQDQDPLLTH